MALRTRSKWFTRGLARAPQQAATVLAVTAWKLGLHTIRRMRGEDYEIEAGARYFEFLREYLVFLLSVSDRLAHARFDDAGRVAFTTALVLRTAELLAENRAEVLGADAAAERQAFVELFNRRGDDYAACGFDERAGPDFSFGRCLGNWLLDIVAEQDRSWVIDQMMSIELPEAFDTLKRVFDGLADTSAPAPAGDARG